MKKLYALLVVVLIGFVGKAQIVNIPDANFKAKLLAASTTNYIASTSSPYGNGGFSTSTVVDSNADGEIQVSEALAIKCLSVYSSQITDFTGIEAFTNLEKLDFSSNSISSANISGMTNMKFLTCSTNQLTSLNVGAMLNLKQLYCSYNQITSLSIGNLTHLTDVDCSSNQIPSLNLTNLNSLQTLWCSGNQLTSLTVSNKPALVQLLCYGNNLSSMILSNLPVLNTLWYQGNHLPSLNLNSFTTLKSLSCSSNQIVTLDVNSLPNLEYLTCGYNLFSSLTISGLTHLKSISCDSGQITNLNLSNLPVLETLFCNTNQITNLNVSNFTTLKILNCQNNLLTSLNVSGTSSLEKLYCDNNQLTTLGINGLSNLKEVYCSNNMISSLVLNGLPNLNTLNVLTNQLTSLDVNSITSLTSLSCSINPIPTLDVSSLINLQILGCRDTLITTMDVSNLTSLNTLYCYNNPNLISLNIKNGKTENSINFSNNPNLQYICADDAQVTSIQNQISTYGYTNCHVNTYCSFTPGGNFYTIQGNSRYDINNNGCDVSDNNIPNLKLSFSDGTATSNLIPDTSGAYRYDVQASTQTFSPVFENPTYFTASPATATVTFPTATSPFTQDFCVTANGVHNDLEVALLPIVAARPGSDAKYKIIYKNKGTAAQSGSVNLAFDDSRLDYVSAMPNLTTQVTNSLSWSFSNLLPFETREILVTLNINSPVETPSVNSGDVLTYTATVTGLTDETPNDNISTLNQTVVNALDPNDKTCAEGTTVSPSMVGQYVHYVVRFENDGTANAQNIVVKDIIDTAKFDISSLVPLSGSASYTTRITSTNKVEFIFQNINLPFAAGTNTGYVAFKIKTKPTLVIGDTFSNTANIYFDYNFPIVTNTASTIIAALATQDFNFGTYFSIYPNPAKQVLNLETRATIIVNSINIYNMLGQMVMAIPNAESVSSIDVSDLKTGTYFIKVNTDKGTANAKFLKE